jgi:L-iditol 2-dehydrogenase
MTCGRGVDAAIVTAGAPNILDQASSMVKKTGGIVLVSMITEKIPVYTYSFVFNEQTLYGAMTYTTDDFKTAAEWVNSGLDLAPLCTHKFPLAETQRALELLSGKSEGTIKIILQE